MQCYPLVDLKIRLSNRQIGTWGDLEMILVVPLIHAVDQWRVFWQARVVMRKGSIMIDFTMWDRYPPFTIMSHRWCIVYQHK